MQWKTLSITTVVYPKDDLYGKFLAFCSLIPVAIIVSFFTLTVFVRDIHVILFFAGQLTNEALNQFLKHTFREDRPEHGWRNQLGDNSYGWPSSHCQFMAFFLIYSTLCIRCRLSKVKSASFCWAMIVLGLIGFIFVSHSRTYLLYHYLHQCIHGTIIGATFGIIWYVLVNNFLEPMVYEHLMINSTRNKIFGLCSIYLPLLNSTDKKCN